MFQAFQAVMTIIVVACVVYLISDPVERVTFFPTRKLGKLLFPKLGHYDRQKRLASLVGIILFLLIIAATTFHIAIYVSRPH